jgi:hypothetical protein
MSILGIATIALTGLSFSALLLVAAKEDWEAFTNPPKWTALFYSQGLLRLLFPREVVRWMTALFGVLIGLATLAFLVATMLGE